MANNAKSEFRDAFDLKKSEDDVQKRGMRLKWPDIAKKEDSLDNF
jgi:hypothetical protein